MDGDMAFLNELVRTIRERHNFTLEQVAAISDLATCTVNRYELGEREVSFRYVRHLFAATGDMQLLRYFSAGVADALCTAQSRQQPAPKRQPPPDGPQDLLARELEAIGDLTQAAKYIERIVRDGRVDQSDHQAILNLHKQHEEVRAIMDAADRSLTAWAENVKAK